MSSRERILGRVAQATASRKRLPHPGALPDAPQAADPPPGAPQAADPPPGAPQAADPPTASQAAAPPPPRPLAAFVKRFTSSGGEVVEADPEHPPAKWLTEFLRGLEPAVAGVAVGPEVPADQRPQLPEVAAAQAGAGISVAWGVAADSGSLILPSTGARAVQLLPPVHVVWIPETRVFARLEDALAELQAGLPAAVGLHSGPSKSADIGRTVVTGVHGPGRCIAVIR